MNRVREHLSQIWADSRAFRIILILALVYVVLRLAVHGAYLAMMLYPNSGIMGGMPEWTGAESEPMVPVDLQVYLDAAENVTKRENLYLQGPITRLEDLYQYPPAFALAFVPMAGMSATLVSVLHTLLHIGAYLALYCLWARIFEGQKLTRASRMLALTTPAWLVFSAFWSDLGYLNIYIITAVLGTLLIDAILRERLGWAILWVSLILQTKPQWAFAAAVPLLTGRRRFFVRLVGGSLLAYGAVIGATMLLTDPGYALHEYGDYVRFLSTLPARFPWRGPEAPYLGYNHSVKQTMIYLIGDTSAASTLAAAVKLVLLAPLGVVGGRYLTQGLRGARLNSPSLAIELALLLYLGAFIWLDMVWELSLGIALFTYLLATGEERWWKGLISAVFIPYALIDLWQLLSVGLLGMDVMDPGPYILTDPSIYVPVVMVVILVFYVVLLKRLWRSSSKGWEASTC
jgi:hypothetical protein